MSDARRRYLGYVGFVTTPRYFDDSVQQFLEVAPAGIGAIQRLTHISDYSYELSERAANFDLLADAAEALAQANCQVIGQVGSNWVHCNGTNPDEIAAYCDALSERIGARFLMAGHSLVEALKALGAERITVTNGYYRDDWAAGINRYLEQAGFELVHTSHMRDQGLYGSLDEQISVETATAWDHPDRDVVKTIAYAAQAAPDVDAIVQTGAGMRTARHVPTLEALFDKPIVASDIALFWAILRELDLGIPIEGRGRLLSCMSR